MSYALIADFLQDRQSFKFFIRHRHQHIKPSAKEIAKVHILKADISILGLQHCVIHQLKCLCDKPFKMSCF
ncbi:hypothetical protein BVG18_15645 (plasmid) [Acinetobacter lwoffii]|nr:hypothetical protein BVG18_15645 [Acinetobacter lwoffii]